MNLTRVLNNALPEIPARILSEKPPRIPPDLVSKEHIEDGVPIVRVVVAGQDAMFKFPPANWQLIQLFDGQRSYEDIAELFSSQTGQAYSVEEVREFADSLEEMEFWYKTPQEKNILLMQKSAEERRKLIKGKKRFGDLSEIAFPAINPDKFVTWWYQKTKFVYTWWFTLITITAFSISIAISVAHWDEIGRDTLEFFTFANKSASDVALFYALAVVCLCWHELGHAHACKHYGGRVPAMGFLLLYLTPAFFTDTTEGFAKGMRHQRFIIAMAGAWSELYLCAVATVIWWGAPPGSGIHNAAYIMILMTGIAGVLLNWNPLMKLDGYYMLSEALGIADLKENSTAFVSAWVKRHIWGLPVEVPYVPKRRRVGFAVYALLSGAYSYTVLFVLARFAGNIFRNFSPEWSFVPELVVAGLIFRSRIRKLVDFMRFLYLDRKDRVRAWFRGQGRILVVPTAALLMLLPLWHDTVDGRFILEPVERVVVRNEVPGTVTKVFAREGMLVAAGETLFELRNYPLQSKVAAGEVGLAVATVQANRAAIQYANLGPALEARTQLAEQRQQLQLEARNLDVVSPTNGTILTPRPGDQLGAVVREGSELAEIGGLGRMRARIYVSDYDMYKVRLGSAAGLNVEGFPKVWEGSVQGITPVSGEIAPAIAETSKYKGLNPLNFFIVDLSISNPGEVLRPGMVGAARIYGERRSLAGRLLREIVRFFGRKVW